MSERGNDSSAGAEWRRLGRDALAAALLEQEEVVRKAQAAQYAMLAEMESRGVLAEYGYGTLDAVQADLLRISRREAKRRSKRARILYPTPGIGAEPVPAVAPASAVAATEGAIGAEHLDVIAGLHGALPTDLPVAEVEAYDKIVADLARDTGPEAVRQAVREIVDRVDADGRPPTDKQQRRPDRELHLGWRLDGDLGIRGRLDPETGRALQAVLSPLTKPRPEPDGTPDARTPAERNADALCDALCDVLDLVQREGGLPTEAGVKPTVTVLLDYNLLLQGLQTVGKLDGTYPITADQARRLSCDAEIIPAVLGSESEVLNLGRSARLATPAQRRAVTLRDKGCVFPGCTRPARWTQIHHIKHWLEHGGATDIDNLCLLCTEHHRLIHHSDWEIRMAEDGHPECIPPAYLDPRRRPRRNYAHHR